MPPVGQVLAGMSAIVTHVFALGVRQSRSLLRSERQAIWREIWTLRHLLMVRDAAGVHRKVDHMTPTIVMILLMAAAAVLRLVGGRGHPLALIPLAAACVVWFSETRGTLWQWAFLALGVALSGSVVYLTIALYRRGRPSRALE